VRSLIFAIPKINDSPEGTNCLLDVLIRIEGTVATVESCTGQRLAIAIEARHLMSPGTCRFDRPSPKVYGGFDSNGGACLRGPSLAFLVMAYSLKSLPPWWDRDLDDSGRPIREDVRAAAIAVWEKVCKIVQQLLGDFDDAAPLLERSVVRVSIYLNDREVPHHDPSGLLILDLYRSARRLAKQRNRVRFAGGTSDLSTKLGAPDWTNELERRIFLDQLVSFLAPEVCGLLRLRMEGFEWDEIAKMLNSDASRIRRRFWKDVRRAQLQLLSRPGRPEKA
jgi:hypothetical protein